MKVLMFGWEFPPHISGGLGTASYGLTKGLAQLDDVEVLFVVPKSYGDEDTSAVKKIIGACDVSISQKKIIFRNTEHQFTSLEVESNLMPYSTQEEFWKLTEERFQHTNAFHSNRFRRENPLYGKVRS